MSLFEVSILLITIFLAVTIVWTTMRVGISPMPSSAHAYQAMLKLTEDTGKGPIYDLGSGWGTLVIRMAIKFPKRQVVGYELSLLPYLVSLSVKRLMKLENLNLYRKDFMKADLSAASVLVCYLYPGAMSELDHLIEERTQQTTPPSSVNRHDLKHQRCKPDFVISNNFALPSRVPESLIRLDDIYRSPVYRYDLSLPVKHTD